MSTENPFNKTNLNHGDYRKLVSKEADKVIKLGTTKMDEDKNLWIKLIK